MDSNFYSLIESRMLSDRTATCLILRDGAELSYGGLAALVGRIARLLVDRGIAPGDRMVVQTEKTPEALALYLATLKIGAIYAPLNSAYTEAEMAYFIGDAEPALVVRDAVALAGEAAALEPLDRSEPRSADDVAALIYTSGTTGRSKGAMLTHGNLAANAQALIEAWGYGGGDVLLHALPIFHVHGLFIALHCALLTGGALIWLPKFDEKDVLRMLPRATVMMGVPTFYTRLLAQPGFERAAAAHMRLFVSGSAPLLESTFAEFEARTGQRILERYGMSEAIVITTNPLVGDRVPGSVGFPLPGVGLRIAGGEDAGGIEICGPSVFSGYWRMPEKTAEEFTADGWFRTGDVGRADADGRVWISGRAKDLIISGGYNVYPKEIELLLDTLEGIGESAVVGVPHPDFGEAVIAVATGKGDEAALIAEARARLAGFKTPKRILFVEELPRNAMGKVQKNLLRDRYAGLFA
ncbi:AMP-binding protein [Flavisphingomonas formosensis]|uniref:AMP-binding protein n=1 Tax=Flavisphingomonas formosensis TaxID=861534 RepID=UPI0012F8DB69|nr:AMP-binding protein [Sphingomonas formosensis]